MNEALARPDGNGTQALATIARATEVLRRYSDEDLEVIRKTVARGASREELAMFLYLANRYRLDPFLGEILLIRVKVKQPDGTYAEGLRLYVPRDGWLKVAIRHPEYEGLDSAPVYEKDEFQADFAAAQVIHRVTSPVRGKVVGAYAIARRRGRKPYLVVVSLDEVRGKTPAWETHPAIMAQTRAEVYAIRRQFEISGLYAPEEFGYASETMAERGLVIEGEATVEPAETPPEPVAPVAEAPPVTVEEYRAVVADAQQRGWTPAQVREAFRQVTGHLPRQHKPTREEFERFRQVLAGAPPSAPTPKDEPNNTLPF